MGNAVCRRCWDRVQIASRASENDDGYRGGIRSVCFDRVGEEDGDSPDAGTGEGAVAGGDNSTTSTGAGDRSSRPEVPPGPPVRIPGRPRCRRRRHHARYQPPYQNRLGMLWEVLHRALRQAKRAIKARFLKAEAMEALLYGCMTWAPRNAHYRQLRTTHHKFLLRVIGYRRVHGTHRNMSYAKALNRKPGVKVLERQFASDGFCSQGPWPDRVASDSLSG